MSTTLPADLSCPRCGAHVRTGSDWCTLCYTDLRPADQREPVAAPAAEPTEPTAGLPTPDLPVTATPTAVASTPAAPAALTPSVAPEQQARGKHARKPSPEEAAAEVAPGTPVPGKPSPEEVDALAAPLLARLAVEESGRPLGRLTGIADTSGKKAALMIGGGLTATLLLIALMALLGVIF
ncbi:MAG TPA: hypothetical protein VFR56_06020 [Actinomycetes bacterium]|nr:hypothetical protein [Actinomycetes bacterium]